MGQPSDAPESTMMTMTREELDRRVRATIRPPTAAHLTEAQADRQLDKIRRNPQRHREAPSMTFRATPQWAEAFRSLNG